MQTYIKAFLSSPVLFLVVIALAIVWQQMNSKRLADKAGQSNRQAISFSWIMAVSIFLCVANDWFAVAVVGAVIEAAVNILLVLKIRQANSYDLTRLNTKMAGLTELQRKGKEKEELSGQIAEKDMELSDLTLIISIFIGVLIPTFIVFMSDLYIKSGQ